MADQKLTNKKKQFNFSYSSLYNIIIRIFGVIKYCFQILEIPTEFAIVIQVKIILILIRLHNFI